MVEARKARAAWRRGGAGMVPVVFVVFLREIWEAAALSPFGARARMKKS